MDVCDVTFPLSETWTDSSPRMTSSPFCGAAPLRCLLKASRALYPNSAAGPQIGCAIWPSCPHPSAAPVLRRSGLFQENSVTKRVSMPVLEQASLKMINTHSPNHPLLTTSTSLRGIQRYESHILRARISSLLHNTIKEFEKSKRSNSNS